MRLKTVHKPRFWFARMVGGGALLAVFLYSVLTFITFEQKAVHVTGQVVKVEKESHATGRRGGRVLIERPLVRFTVPNSTQEVTATAKVRSRQSFAEGDSVPLEFLPGEPAGTVRVESGLSMLEIAFGFVGSIMVFFGCAEKLRYRRELREQEQLAAAGANRPGAAALP